MDEIRRLAAEIRKAAYVDYRKPELERTYGFRLGVVNQLIFQMMKELDVIEDVEFTDWEEE